MWFDCVVGETGEPGRHFRANLAQQHLPPSFAGIDWGQQVEEGGRERGKEVGLVPVLTRSLLEGNGCVRVCVFIFVPLIFFFSLIHHPLVLTLQVLFSKSSCQQNVQTGIALMMHHHILNPLHPSPE